MHLIFEEDGHFKAGSILSETDATAAGGNRLGQAQQDQDGQHPAALRRAVADRGDGRAPRR
ncbi:MAG: hypothetical protein MZV65_02145 [Chromatiales bacterium]|nr:hypothetical protein [Chromatiales bacterium]